MIVANQGIVERGAVSMEDPHFDAFTKALATHRSRRRLVQSMVGGVLIGMSTPLVGRAEEQVQVEQSCDTCVETCESAANLSCDAAIGMICARQSSWYAKAVCTIGLGTFCAFGVFKTDSCSDVCEKAGECGSADGQPPMVASVLQLGQTLVMDGATLSITGEVLAGCAFYLRLTYRSQSSSSERITVPGGLFQVYDDQGGQWFAYDLFGTRIVPILRPVTLEPGASYTYDLQIVSPVQPAQEYTANLFISILSLLDTAPAIWGLRWDRCMLSPLPTGTLDPR